MTGSNEQAGAIYFTCQFCNRYILNAMEPILRSITVEMLADALVTHYAECHGNVGVLLAHFSAEYKPK